MKKIFLILFAIALTFSASATQQVPDKLQYNNLILELNTGWGHPSPLQTYFFQNKIPYPFEGLSTANYRGHIASWVILDNRFYLKEINIDGKIRSPHKYGIKAVNNPTDDMPALVLADWFSGVIECTQKDTKGKWKTISTFYFQIRYGRVISMGEVLEKDYEGIKKMKENDTADDILRNKYNLLVLDQNYIAYYYRLNESDVINFINRDCKLNTGIERLSPIFALYSNEHLNWPYNWENLEKSGAPNCSWKIENDSLLLTGLQLFSGRSFDSINKEDINLGLLLPGKVINGNVFADWVSGVHLIIYGVDTTYGSGYKEFKPKKYIYCRFEKGILKESYSLPFDYDLKQNKDKLDARLRKLMKEYQPVIGMVLSITKLT